MSLRISVLFTGWSSVVLNWLHMEEDLQSVANSAKFPNSRCLKLFTNAGSVFWVDCMCQCRIIEDPFTIHCLRIYRYDVTTKECSLIVEWEYPNSKCTHCSVFCFVVVVGGCVICSAMGCCSCKRRGPESDQTNVKEEPVDARIESIFFEKQEGMLCAQHALNSLLQGPYFTAVELAEIARNLDEMERQVLNAAHMESHNMDDSGFFSAYGRQCQCIDSKTAYCDPHDNVHTVEEMDCVEEIRLGSIYTCKSITALTNLIKSGKTKKLVALRKRLCNCLCTTFNVEGCDCAMMVGRGTLAHSYTPSTHQQHQQQSDGGWDIFGKVCAGVGGAGLLTCFIAALLYRRYVGPARRQGCRRKVPQGDIPLRVLTPRHDEVHRERVELLEAQIKNFVTSDQLRKLLEGFHRAELMSYARRAYLYSWKGENKAEIIDFIVKKECETKTKTIE